MKDVWWDKEDRHSDHTLKEEGIKMPLSMRSRKKRPATFIIELIFIQGKNKIWPNQKVMKTTHKRTWFMIEN